MKTSSVFKSSLQVDELFSGFSALPAITESAHMHAGMHTRKQTHTQTHSLWEATQLRRKKNEAPSRSDVMRRKNPVQ